MRIGSTGRRQRPALPLLAVYAAGFVTAFSAHAVAANLGRYAEGRHASLVDLGVLLALYDGAEVALKPVFGSLADRIGPKPVLLGGLLAFAVASAAFVIAGNPALLGVARFAQGSAAAAFSPAAGALVALIGKGGRRGRSFGGYGAAKSLGYLTGPLAGGALVLAGGYGLLFGLIALLAFAVAATAWFVVPALRPVPRRRETLVGLCRRLGERGFLGPVAVLAAATAATSVAVGFFPVQGGRVHLSPLVTGAVVSLVAGAAIILQLRTGKALDEGRLRHSASAWGLGTAALGLALAAVPSPLTLIAASVFVGVGAGVAMPIGFAGLAEAAPPGRMGQTMGAGEVGRELGDAGGPLLVGVLAPLGLGIGLVGLAGILGLLGGFLTRTGAGSAERHQ